jgi:5-methylcytosine-specific restriction endonuclease McrA
VRKKFLRENPACSVCGAKTGKLEVHHILPFHLHPENELNPKNFIVLCENNNDGANCHLLFGHLGSFRSYNPNVKKDAAIWNKKIKNRPKPLGN